jgi:hypothetical protein
VEPEPPSVRQQRGNQATCNLSRVVQGLFKGYSRVVRIVRVVVVGMKAPGRELAISAVIASF